MTAIWFRARAELRRGWRSMLLLGLLVGLLAGGAVAAAAGARRTQSAYPRFLERYGVYHTSVSPAEEDLDEVARIPQVTAVAPSLLFFGSVTARGVTVSFPDIFLIAGMAPDGAPDPAKLLEGRRADQNAVDEVVVNYAVAERLGAGPGATLQATLSGMGPDGPREERVTVRVAGIVVEPGGFETLTGRGFPNVIGFTRAFGLRYRDLADRSGGAVAGVALRRGEADLDAFTRELRARGIETDGPPTPTSDFTEDVQELNRVPAFALWSLSSLLGIAALAIFGQAIARETTIGAADHPILRALGWSRRGLFSLGMVRALGIAAVGASAAAVVAILASPLTPVGIARVAEPDPGFAVDAAAIGLGAAVTLVAVAVTALFPAWRRASLAGTSSDRIASRRSRVAEGLAGVSAPPAAVVGVRMALEPGHGAGAIPVRSATVGAAIAIAAVVAALVFASSLDHLLGTPRLTGYTWDAAVLLNEPDGAEAIEDALPKEIVARTWKGVVFPLIDVGGLSITAFASDGPPPPVIDGRAPETPDEIALDPLTLERLGTDIGDRVVVSDASETGTGPVEPTEPRDLLVVGSFVVARLPFQPVENASQGAALTPGGLQSIDPFEYEVVHVKFSSETDLTEGIERVKEATAGVGFAVFTPQQLGAVRNLQRISVLPSVAAGLLAAVAVGTMIHTLVSTGRRRRNELAILKTVGFVGRQVRAILRWQSTTLALVALAVGLPVGLAAGRWAWRLFAREIIVVPVPVVSVASIVGTIPLTILLANLVAALPARAAARTQPAVVLRTE